MTTDGNAARGRLDQVSLLGREPAAWAGPAPVTRLRRVDLALVVAAELLVAVGPLGRGVEGHQAELRDRQPRAKDDRDAVEVGDLERERAPEARVNEPGRCVHDQAEAAEARFSLDSRHDVIGELDELLGAAEHELVRMDHEGVAVFDRDVLGQVLRRIGEVDHLDPVVVEDAERRPELEVDACGLDHRGVPGIDAEPAVGYEAADRAVGEDGCWMHAPQSRSGRGTSEANSPSLRSRVRRLAKKARYAGKSRQSVGPEGRGGRALLQLRGPSVGPREY